MNKYMISNINNMKINSNYKENIVSLWQNIWIYQLIRIINLVNNVYYI